MKQQVFKFVLAVLVALFSLHANASIEMNGLYYELDSDAKTAEVTSGDNKYTGAIVIPGSFKYKGVPYTVTSIGDCAFQKCEGLVSVSIPESVESIGVYAFSECGNLTSIVIPNGVEFISEGAFSYCTGMTTVTIGDGVYFLGDGAFYNCNSLTSITVGENNATYDSRNNCNAIIKTASNTLIKGCNNTNIPNSVTNIGSGAFEFCENITSITIPESVNTIGEMAFADCNGLESVIISKSVTSIGGWAFSNCSSLKKVYCYAENAPQTGDNVFYNVKTRYVFLRVPAESYELYKTAEVWKDFNGMGYDAMETCGKFDLYYTTYARSQTAELVIAKDNGLDLSGDVTISSTVKKDGSEYTVTSIGTIGGWAFMGCTGLTSVIIPEGVETIEHMAFSGCADLASVTIPNSVTEIGESAFSGCSSLTSIVIPNSVTEIAYGTFFGCSGLTSVTIPNSVTDIAGRAFEGCTNLDDVYCYAEDVPVGTIGYWENQYYYAFDEYTIKNVTTLHVPAASKDAYKSEDKEQWKDFWLIRPLPEIQYIVDGETYKTVIVPIGKKIIPEAEPSKEGYVFSGWSSIPAIMPSENVTVTGSFTLAPVKIGSLYYELDAETQTAEVTIKNTGFSYYGNIIIPESVKYDGVIYSVTSIGIGAFQLCPSLESVTIPESVTYIGGGAFYDSKSLESVIIGKSVTSIGEEAFYGCESLTDVYCYAEDVPEILPNPYSSAPTVNLGNVENATLHVPAASIDAYKAAEAWKDFGNIVALPEIVPMEEGAEITFDESITEETDLTDIVIDNVYVTLDTEGNDGYDTEEKCIVLASTVTEEQLEVIANKEVQDKSVKENFNGLIFEVPAGKGTISINVQTKGSHALKVKIGNAEAQTFVQSERGDVQIPYTTTEATYVYIYGATIAAGAQRRISGNETENGVLIYDIKWTQEESTDINAVATTDDDTYQIYTPDGTPVQTLQPGVNILHYSNGQVKKVFVK